MRRLLAAVGFLTIIPLPRSVEIRTEDHGGSAVFYPIVGFGIGAALALLAYGLGFIMPPWPKAALLMIAMSAISGGLHIDGLADSFDGLMSARPRERALEIMRDSRLGAMGAFAMVCVLTLKFSALASMDGDEQALAIFTAAMTGRCAMSLSIIIFPYVRAEGLGAAFHGKAGWGTVNSALAGVGLAGGLAGYAGLTGAGYFMWIVMLAWTAIFGLYCQRRIGGMTGDTYGALCETMEAVCLLVVAGYLYVR